MSSINIKLLRRNHHLHKSQVKVLTRHLTELLPTEHFDLPSSAFNTEQHSITGFKGESMYMFFSLSQFLTYCENGHQEKFVKFS